jgi:hypothetical protein
MGLLARLGLGDRVPHGVHLAQGGAKGQHGRLGIEGGTIVPHAIGERCGRAGGLLQRRGEVVEMGGGHGWVMDRFTLATVLDDTRCRRQISKT